ncbi:MAG: GNAT family N-acetyltransferase [Telluria sp.]
MAVEYVVARDGTELAERLYRFRYQIYGGELGIALDHYPAGQMRDRLDAAARNYVAVRDGEVIGSLRTCDLADLPEHAQFGRNYNLPFILAFFAPNEVTYVSRMAVGAEARHTPVMVRLQQYAVQEARARGVRLAFTDCSPKHLPLYGPIGYTPYGPPFEDPVFGLKVPILTVGGDLKLLQERRSPLLKACAPYGDDAEARHWFERQVQARRALPA